jgi:phytoene desaturase
MGRSAVVIGGGFGGLATACLLGKAGYKVTLLEKNNQLGGRAGLLEADGFRFDTGPSWYLMPEVFEHFFELLDEKLEDHIELVRLHPNYRVFYKDRKHQLDITGMIDVDAATFDEIEPGAGTRLVEYLDRAARIHDMASERFLYKNYDSWRDLARKDVLRSARDLKIFRNMHTDATRYFKDPRLQQIVQYPAVFLGTSPYQAPAIYNLLTHASYTQGVFYPMGGMYSLVRAMEEIGKKHGVTFRTGVDTKQVIVKDGKTRGVRTSGGDINADIVISNAGPHHTESALLEKKHRDYTGRYWKRRTLAPSALLMYLGVNREYPSLLHHNLLFSKRWRKNFTEIFGKKSFPADPSLYVCAPGKTDPSVAPKGHENLFVLVPLSAGLTYTPEQLERFADNILATLEEEMHLTDLRKHIVFKKLFCAGDFAEQFNSHQGSGLGLAHTLRQSAAFRPKNKSKKVDGLYYVGANVHPGIGVPPALISAELVYKRLINDSSDSPLAKLS